MSEETYGLKFLEPLRRWTLTKDMGLKVAITVGLIVLLGLFFPRGETIELETKTGVIWTHTSLLAPFSFPILRDAREYENEVAEIRAKVFPVFERDVTAAELQLKELDSFFFRLQETLKARARYRVSSAHADSISLARLYSQLEVKFSEREWAVFDNLSPARLKEMHQIVRNLSEKYLKDGILSVEMRTLNRPQIALRKGTTEEILPISNFYDPHQVVSILDADLIAAFKSDNDTVDVAHKIGVVHQTPNIIFNETATELATTAATESVPRTAGFVEEGERIVAKNERITPEINRNSTRYKKQELSGAVFHRALFNSLVSSFMLQS